MRKFVYSILFAVSAAGLSAAEQGRSLFIPTISYYTGRFSTIGTYHVNGF